MCGIIGIHNQEKEAAPDLYLGLLNMQHRGKESAGIVTSFEGKLLFQGGMGELPQAFWLHQGNSESSTNDLVPKSLDRLKGRIGTGQVRYSTTGDSHTCNIQPKRGLFHGRDFYVCHNGNIVNQRELRKITNTPEKFSDTQVITDLVSLSQKQNFEDAVVEIVKILRGAFNLIFIFNDTLYIVKDRFGFHPLLLAEKSGDYIVASESCVFDHLGARLLRNIDPGEFIIIDRHSYKAFYWTKDTHLKLDLFKEVYFQRPDSIAHSIEAGEARYWMGFFTATLHPIEADVVIPVPDSGNEAARGYYEGLRILYPRVSFSPYALFRPHTVSRTFIEPVEEKRDKSLRLKFNPRRSQIENKVVIAVDDSLVRGKTGKVVVRLLREGGAKKVYLIIPSPMYLYPDFYGIDTYRVQNELIARRLTGNTEAIKQAIGADYLGYSTLEATIAAVLKASRPEYQLTPANFYTGPFTREYPAGTGDFTIQ